MKGYKTMTFNAAIILAAILAFLQNNDLPGIIVAALKTAGVDITPETVNLVLYVVIGAVGLLLRWVTDTPVPFRKNG